MTRSRTAALYTPEVLELAAGLAAFPQDQALPLAGTARSAACGSNLALRLALGADGTIGAIGISAHACAIGQAAATLFARAALGRSPAQIAEAEAAVARWLAGEAPLADWPGLAAIAPAAAWPARHGAILLGWRAALAALSSDGQAR